MRRLTIALGLILGTCLAVISPAIGPGHLQAFGQTNRCEISDLGRSSIDTLKTTNDKANTGITTAKLLIDNWRITLASLMKEIEEVDPLDQPRAWKPYIAEIVNIVKTVLANNDQAIPLFRECRTDRTIKPLVWAARGEVSSLRLNAANILANVVDNTTVCFVLHHLLRDETIIDAGRANLLGVTVAMASYAYKDNAVAIRETQKVVRERIRGKDLPQTEKILAELLARTERSPNRDQALPQDLSKYCKGYPYDTPLR